MILITLGTQDKPFSRLLEKVEEQIIRGIITDTVVVQAGCTKYKTDKMQLFDFLPMDKFNELTEKAELIITHGGVGSIVNALKLSKKVIACPRLSKYGEHTNDHQLQITGALSRGGYILELGEEDELDKLLKKARRFEPKKFQSNRENMLSLVEQSIDSFL